MKKILILTPDFYPLKGGVELFVYNIAKNLKKKNIIKVFSGSRISKLDKNKKYTIQDIKIEKFPTFKLFGLDFPKSLLTYFKLLREIRKNDFIFLNDIKFFFFSSLICSYLLKKKTLFVTHGLFYHNDRYLLAKRLLFRVYVYFLKRFTSIIVSNGLVDYNLLKKNSIKSKLINNGIDLNKFKCKRKKIIKNQFLYFGRIDTNKGLENLIDFLSFYKKTNSKFKLVVLGKGNTTYMKFLKKKIIANGLKNDIFFKGFFSHQILIKHLSKAEFVFNPSKFESFGYTLIETLASGSTVIASNINQYKYIKKKTSAFYITDFKNFKKTIKIISKAREKYKSINTEAKKLAKNYSIKSNFNSYNNILDEFS